MVDKITAEEDEIFHPENFTVATTTFYPEYNNPNSPDRIRGNLALRLAENSIKRHFGLVIVDGGSSEEFIEKLNSLGVIAIPQKNSGMDESRFQAYKEAVRNPRTNVVAWIEIEKAPLISDELWQAALQILGGKIKVIVPARSNEGFNSVPGYQRLSEKSANSILETTLKKYGISTPQIDWFFGPKMFHKSLLAEFTNETPFWMEFRNRLKTEKSHLVKSYGYTGPLILPVIKALYDGLPVASFEMTSYRHPESQTRTETDQKDTFLKRRLMQLEKINLTVDFFCKFLAHPKTADGSED